MNIDDLKKTIRDVPDFPKKGIVFKDITTLLKDQKAFKYALDILVKECKKCKPDKIAGIESRGFIFGAPVAKELGKGFIPIRKPNKLPAETISQSYELEYGTDSVEIHKDAIAKGERVVLIDDLLATGGTAKAASDLIKKCGGEVVLIAFCIELTFLNGREKLQSDNVFSIISY